jgi:superfamily II DNA or RNA helicase
MTRDERQKQSLNAWTVQGYQGCLQAVTGFGKTRIAMMALRGLKKKGLINTATVTVPTIVLKEQWKRELESFGVADFTTVVVNNTAAMRPQDFACDLLICDEVHTVPTNTRDVILQIAHKYFLGLSATIERQDGRHEEIIERYPVFDVVRFDECIKNEWISPYKIYNVPVDMPDDLMKKYGAANNQFRGIAAKLSAHDRNTMRVANLWLAKGDAKEKQLGALYYKFMNARKYLCINNPNKIEIVKNIVSLCPDRYGIIFSQSIGFADEITKSIGEGAVTFHSKLTKKNQDKILDNFKDKDSSTRIISSVQALDAGFDFVDLSLAVVAAGYSSKLTNVQRTGRTVRAKKGKKAVIINLYSKNTQEIKWLEERQKDDKHVTYLKSPEALYEICNRISARESLEPKRADIPSAVEGESL